MKDSYNITFFEGLLWFDSFQYTLMRYENAPLNFRTSFQWNRNGEICTQLPKLLSHLLGILKSKHLCDFIKRRHSSMFCFTLGWMKNEFWTTCGSQFETKWLNYEDNLCRMTIQEKKNLFQNLQRLLGWILKSTEKPRFCRFEERN